MRVEVFAKSGFKMTHLFTLPENFRVPVTGEYIVNKINRVEFKWQVVQIDTVVEDDSFYLRVVVREM